jgi:hypothetical protein
MRLTLDLEMKMRESRGSEVGARCFLPLTRDLMRDRRMAGSIPVLMAALLLAACASGNIQDSTRHLNTRPDPMSQQATRTSSDTLIAADSSCSAGTAAVSAVLFDEARDVHIAGRSIPSEPSELPDGRYHVLVASPDGTVLGTSGGNSVITVTDGRFDGCPRLIDLVTSPTTGDPGFDKTNDATGRYWVGISLNPIFTIAESTNTAFSLRSSGATEAALSYVTFYDANTNGVADRGELLIEGWLVTVTNETDGFTDEAFSPWSATVTPGNYSVMELNPDQFNWRATTPSPVGIALAADQNATISIGHVCLGPGGGETTAYWTARAGAAAITPVQLQAVSERNLVNGDGSAFDPSTYQDLRTWMQRPSIDNIANLLSISLATMTLNVSTSKMDQFARVHAPSVATANPAGFITIADLMVAADTALADAELANAPVDDYRRGYLEAIHSPIERANNNLDVVQPTLCPLSFDERTGTEIRVP